LRDDHESRDSAPLVERAAEGAAAGFPAQAAAASAAALAPTLGTRFTNRQPPEHQFVIDSDATVGNEGGESADKVSNLAGQRRKVSLLPPT
jgi:hypothetical protein